MKEPPNHWCCECRLCARGATSNFTFFLYTCNLFFPHIEQCFLWLNNKALGCGTRETYLQLERSQVLNLKLYLHHIMSYFKHQSSVSNSKITSHHIILEEKSVGTSWGSFNYRTGGMMQLLLLVTSIKTWTDWLQYQML